jgi:hydrogenase-4 component H
MGILRILSRNSARGSRTRRPEDEVAYPAGFRGLITHDTASCTGCRTCAYVCSPAAIAFGEADSRFVEWTYFAGQCTFCGRCVEYCPTRALGFEEAMPPVARDQSAHRVTHRVPYQPCARCGQPIIPLPLQTLQLLYDGSVPEGIAVQHSLCERCRQRTTALRLRSPYGAGDHA